MELFVFGGSAESVNVVSVAPSVVPTGRSVCGAVCTACKLALSRPMRILCGVHCSGKRQVSVTVPAPFAAVGLYVATRSLALGTVVPEHAGFVTQSVLLGKRVASPALHTPSFGVTPCVGMQVHAAVHVYCWPFCGAHTGKVGG